MDACRADAPRERGVFPHQKDQSAPARDGGEAAGEGGTLRHAVVAEDDGASRRQRTSCGQGIGETCLVGHQDERGQRAPRSSFETGRRLC